MKIKRGLWLVNYIRNQGRNEGYVFIELSGDENGNDLVNLLSEDLAGAESLVIRNMVRVN